MAKFDFEKCVGQFSKYDIRWLELYGFSYDDGRWTNQILEITFAFDLRDQVVLALIDERTTKIKWSEAGGIPVPLNLGVRNQLPNIYMALGGSFAECLKVDVRISTQKELSRALEAYSRMLALVIPQLSTMQEFQGPLVQRMNRREGTLAWL